MKGSKCRKQIIKLIERSAIMKEKPSKLSRCLFIAEVRQNLSTTSSKVNQFSVVADFEPPGRPAPFPPPSRVISSHPHLTNSP
jgi:hypothetical protein